MLSNMLVVSSQSLHLILFFYSWRRFLHLLLFLLLQLLLLMLSMGLLSLIIKDFLSFISEKNKLVFLMFSRPLYYSTTRRLHELTYVEQSLIWSVSVG